MRTKTVTLYRADELSPEAFERAHAQYCGRLEDIPWQDETIDSLKELFKRCDGVRLGNWSLGAYNRGNFLIAVFSQDETAHLTGARAFAWLENNLFSKLRVPFKPLRARYWFVRGRFTRTLHARHGKELPLDRVLR